MCSKVISIGVILSLTLAGFVKGSCLEYGHSCWGAHGKRSIGKIYRSIDGSGIQQTEGNRDIHITQDEVKPSELLNILLERNARLNSDETPNFLDISNRKNLEDIEMLDASKQLLRRKLRNAFRKGIIFNYSPTEDEKYILKSQKHTNKFTRHLLKPETDINTYYEDNQIENNPLFNQDMEYLDLK